MEKCEQGLEIGQCTCTADHCSKCGGEKDAEGWCANYCSDDDSVDCRRCDDKGFVACDVCNGQSYDKCSADCNGGDMICPDCGGYSALSD